MLNYQIVDNSKEEWVVFVHGMGGSTKTWGKQIDLFSEKYNLLLLDLPGHGENSNNVIRKVNQEQLNQEIVDTMNYLGIESAHFVGMSLGTLVIANFASQNPSYVKRIILGGAVLSIRGMGRMWVRVANLIKRAVPYKFLYKFFVWFLMPRKNHEKSRKIFLREVVKLNKETMFAWIEYLLSALHLEKVIAKLDQLGKEILFISGDEDHCFLGGSIALAKRMKNATFKLIKHCGHVCTIEKAAIFNSQALVYLAG